METTLPPKANTRKTLTALIFALMALEGLAGLFTLFRVRSETGSAFLLGYSLSRLAIGGAVLAAVLAFAALAYGAASAGVNRQPGWWQRLSRAAARAITSPGLLFGLAAVLLAAFLGILALLLLTSVVDAHQLVTERALVQRAGFVFAWIELCILQLALLAWLNSPRAAGRQPVLSPLHWVILLAVAVVPVYDAAFVTYATTTWRVQVQGHAVIYLPVLAAVLMGLHDHFFRASRSFEAVRHLLLLAMVGVSTYAIYQHTLLWASSDFTPAKAYWHLLADAFLRGRLYLENPGATHDLTFFNGHWFVPNPPLPAFIVMPFVALFGVEGVNMVRFSIAIGAVSAVLLYQALAKASSLAIIPTGRAGNLLLVAVAVLGTSHWWLAIKGQMWFTSQLLTLIFTTLAVLLVLTKRSPWLVGLSLGTAILARPNAFTLWPLLLGLKLYLDAPTGGMALPKWKPLLAWAAQSAVPVCLGAAGLLFYNFIRFGSWLDFGYVTINSAEWLMSAVQTYGMFNLHFVPANFYAMFLKLPGVAISGGCFYYSPTHEGIAILAATPAAIYAVRRFRLNWWTVGAWVSIVLSLGLLLFYHNTGAWQMGYRYLMDFLMPVLLLMGLGMGKRPSWAFIALAAASILITLAGNYWWFTGWWCHPG